MPDTAGFLPCCPVDCQSVLAPSDLLLDEFMSLETILGSSEDIINMNMRESIDDKNETYMNLEEEKFVSEVMHCNLVNEFIKKEEKSVLYLESKSEDDNQDNIILPDIETIPQLSMISDILSNTILEKSDNESFQDLKEFNTLSTLTTITSDKLSEISSIINSEANTTSSGIESNYEHSQYQLLEKCDSRLSSSSSSYGDDDDDDESYEPKRKVSKVSKTTSFTKDKRYLEMRKKNNCASRRSRLSKKQKEKEMEEKEKQLIKENGILREEAEKLEQLVQKCKELLFNSIGKKN